MSSAVIQLLVLAGIAVFLILRLRSVLGTRDGYEKPPVTGPEKSVKSKRPEFEVIEGGPDRDITDHVPDGSPSAKALGGMKLAEPSFSVGEFLHGARGAYEMILMAFENGNLDEVRSFLSDDVAEAFESVIEERRERGLSIEASFVGVREVALVSAEYDRASQLGDITIRFVGEMTSAVYDESGQLIEGSKTEIKRQRDVWTFSRHMGSDDPNWHLTATGE